MSEFKLYMIIREWFTPLFWWCLWPCFACIYFVTRPRWLSLMCTWTCRAQIWFFNRWREVYGVPTFYACLSAPWSEQCAESRFYFLISVWQIDGYWIWWNLICITWWLEHSALSLRKDLFSIFPINTRWLVDCWPNMCTQTTFFFYIRIINWFALEWCFNITKLLTLFYCLDIFLITVVKSSYCSWTENVICPMSLSIYMWISICCYD